MAWAELSDCRCYYEVLGEGEPLVLIPGLGSTTQFWDCVAPDLSPFFSLILFDNRGLGRSEAKRTPRSLSDLVSDIVELLDHLQVERAHVMGVSLGGVIAQRFAIDHSSRVNRLALISCADVFSPYLTQMASLLAHSLRRMSREKFVRMFELLGTAPEFLDANSELVEQRIRAKCDSRTSARDIGTQLRCLAASEFEPEHYRISAPTLVMAGEFDPIIPSCYAKRMARKIPGSEFHLVPGSGHVPLLDHPQLALPPLIDFLRRKDVKTDLVNVISTGGSALPWEFVQGGDGR